MKRKYRIKRRVYSPHSNPYILELFFYVQVRNVFGVWTTVKVFHDEDDPEYAECQAEELYETLIED